MSQGARYFAKVSKPGIARDPVTNEPMPSSEVSVMNGTYPIISIETVTGGEVRRGRQMQGGVNVLVIGRHLLDQFIVNADCFLDIQGTKRRIQIVAAYDPDGTRREWHMQGREGG